MPERGSARVEHVQRADRRRRIAPCAAHVARQHGDLVILDPAERRHAERPRIATSWAGSRRATRCAPGWRRVDRHRAVAGQRRVGAWAALAALAVAAGAMLVVELGAVLGRGLSGEQRARGPARRGVGGRLLRNTVIAAMSAFVQVLRAVQHHFGHRAQRGAARPRCRSRSARQSAAGHSATPASAGRGQRRRVPVLHRDQAAGEVEGWLRAPKALRAVWQAAQWPRPAHQIGAAVPLAGRAAAASRRRAEIQRAPDRERRLHAVGAAQRVRPVRPARPAAGCAGSRTLRRRPRASPAGVVRIRERGVQQPAVARSGRCAARARNRRGRQRRCRSPGRA